MVCILEVCNYICWYVCFMWFLGFDKIMWDVSGYYGEVVCGICC